MREAKLLIVTALLLTISVVTKGQMPDSRFYRQMSGFPFVIVSEEDITTPPQISDSLFDAAARGIRFKANSTELQPADPFIPLYIEQIVPLLQSKRLELRRVFVRGAASPEGSYQNNVRLARGRTRRLIEFLDKGLGQSVADIPLDAKDITEDYALLVKMMKESGDADYDEVSTLWQECNGDELCCKRRLQALRQGTVWRRLLREYFPALRQARVILWFALRKDAPMRGRTLDAAPTMTEPSAEATMPLSEVTPVVIEPAMDYERRHLIAVRTNLLHDLLYVPQFGWAPGINVQLEYYPRRGHYTINVGYTHITHRRWSAHKFFQMRDAQLEVRRYFAGGGRFLGLYLGAYAEGFKYGIGFSKTKGWQGEGGGGGFSVGYTCHLNRKGSLRMEFSASLGFFITRYDPYVYGNTLTKEEDGLYYYDYYGNASEFKERNHRLTWFGPTNAGIHLTYDIIYRKKTRVKDEKVKDD